MPEPLLFIIITVIALLGMVVMSWGVTIGPRPARPDPLAESAAAQRAAITAADTARASAHAANTAELAEFDAEARRVLDALPAPCVCSQVLTHEWDERTQTYRQRWVVPEHFTSCAKHWPATTGAPPARTVTARPREGGPLVTPAARVDAERARYVAEAWARGVTEIEVSSGVRVTPGGIDYTPTPRGDAATPLEHSTTTTGVPDDCTCVPDHTRALLALTNTRVVHRVDCATNRGPHAAEWRPVSDNG